jgi:plasmid replication initiation protein
MAKPIKNNKDVFQSYILTMAKYDFSVYEKRILYRLVEMAQKDFQGIKYRDNMHQLEPTMFGDVDITMPVRDILRNGETDKNYSNAKKAFKSLATKGIEYEDDDVWLYTNIIEHPQVKKGTGIATFRVYREIWRCIENFSKGYRKFELAVTMNFKSVYAMRFYEFLSGQTQPMTYVNEKFQELCDILKLSKKMRGAQRFENDILNVAKSELDASSPYTFTYERVTVPSRGRNGEKVIGYTFYPHYQPKNRDPELERQELAAKVTPMRAIKTQLRDYLLYNLNWTKDAIAKNKTTLMAAQDCMSVDEIIEFLQKKNHYARIQEMSHPIGYMVNSLKGRIQELKGKQGV